MAIVAKPLMIIRREGSCAVAMLKNMAVKIGALLCIKLRIKFMYRDR